MSVQNFRSGRFLHWAMRVVFFLFLILFSARTYAQHPPEVAGQWYGSILIMEEELGVNIIFEYSDGELDGAMDIPSQFAFNLPVEVTEAGGETFVFQFETGTGQAVFYGRWLHDENTIDGEFEQLGQRFPFHLTRRISSGGRLIQLPEQELIIPTRAGQLSGSLILTKEPSPLVILLTGSGSQDRDENVAGFRVFWLLSSILYEHGYSSFRYDDRGIGKSEGNEDATLHELAIDVADVAGYLRSNYGDQFTSLYLIGHSQGGLVASIIADEIDADGIIFMGAPFLRGDEIINMQIRLISEEMNVPEAIVEQNLEFQELIYDVARNESSWDEIELDLKDRLLQQLNQLPDQQRNALGDMSSFIQSQVDRQLSTAKSRWFKSLIEFEPADIISNIHVPMLAIFGENDMQVPLKQNIEAAEQLRDEVVSLEIAVIPHANHLFQHSNSGMPSEYGMLERTFTDAFIDTITDWLMEVSLAKAE